MEGGVSLNTSAVRRTAAAGACAGLVNGLFGGGGGMVLIPLLIHWIGLEEKRAFAASLAVMLPVSMVSAVVYLFCTDLRLAEALPYLLGGLLGGILASRSFRLIPAAVLRKLLALFLLWGSLRYLL